MNKAGNESAVGLGGRRNSQRAGLVKFQILDDGSVGERSEKAPGPPCNIIRADGMPVLDGMTATVEMTLERLSFPPGNRIRAEGGNTMSDGCPTGYFREIEVVPQADDAFVIHPGCQILARVDVFGKVQQILYGKDARRLDRIFWGFRILWGFRSGVFRLRRQWFLLAAGNNHRRCGTKH